MLKYLAVLVLAFGFAPFAGHAAVSKTCDDLRKQVEALDREVVCAQQKGGNARLDVMLERNFLTQVYEMSRCPDRSFSSKVLQARERVRCER